MSFTDATTSTDGSQFAMGAAYWTQHYTKPSTSQIDEYEELVEEDEEEEVVQRVERNFGRGYTNLQIPEPIDNLATGHRQIPERAKVGYEFVAGIVFLNCPWRMRISEIYAFVDVYMPGARTIKNDNWKNAIRNNVTKSKYFESMDIPSNTNRRECAYHFDPSMIEEWRRKFKEDYGSGEDFLASKDDRHDLYHGRKGAPTQEQIGQAEFRDAKMRQYYGLKKGYRDDAILARHGIPAPIRRMEPPKIQKVNRYQPYQRIENKNNVNRINYQNMRGGQRFQLPTSSGALRTVYAPKVHNVTALWSQPTCSRNDQSIPQMSRQQARQVLRSVQAMDHTYSANVSTTAVYNQTSRLEKIPQQSRSVLQDVLPTDYTSCPSNSTAFSQKSGLEHNNTAPVYDEEEEVRLPKLYPVQPVINPADISLFDF